jgi:glyceraldehyde 3-phosphate dehydrogenase
LTEPSSIPRIRVGINGFGRIGRAIVRALFDSGRSDQFELVAINELGDLSVSAHLLQFDSAHGRFATPVSCEGDELVIGEQRVRYLREPDPACLPWRELGVDVVLECTGQLASRRACAAHLRAGAPRVLISAQASDTGGEPVDATVVYGVNHERLRGDMQIVSNASCSANCIAPLVVALERAIGIESGLITSVHAYTNDQWLTDSHHPDLRRARAGAVSVVPTPTGAARALAQALPEFDSRFGGHTLRVPTLNVSMIDLSLLLARDADAAEVDAVLRRAAANDFCGVLQVSDVPLVSVDFNHHPASSVYDATLTQVVGRQAKVCAWYDNEWGFANRMLDTARAWCEAE